MAQVVGGTFATGSAASAANVSDSLMVHSSITTMRLTITGLNGSNTVKTQKRTTPGGTFSDQTTYNSDQDSVAVTVASGEEWRVFQITQQATWGVRYKMSLES